ncbi:hypothetical protein OHB12_34275 [Nocardia sp. NBC_01730]|uniref:hypothetical protein n=1 Tax=Nocardia sp. NBC_01730 TaxID=2975998 RepID=UPI002E1276BA|nr:hypothetical protein OHB12_34275 [Nocardia sp. NBC_01730]
MNREAYLNELVDGMFGDKRPDEIAPCPFTDTEIAELESSDELLVYVPAGLSARELCELFDIRANIDFDVEANMIRTVMVSESHWFVTSAAKVPELIGSSGKYAKREYDDEGLHGLDLRRYLRFCAAFKARNGVFPDRTYWTFLLSGSYDRSGISIVGFDAWGNLSHHGWMRNFEAKFCGARYAVLAPRIELLPQTIDLPRARRGVHGKHGGDEAGLDRRR